MSDPDVDYETVKVQDLKDTITIKYHVKYQLTQGKVCQSGSTVQRKDTEKRIDWCYCGDAIRRDWGNLRDCNPMKRCGSKLYPFGATGIGFTPACDHTVDQFVSILGKSGGEASNK
ncbi:hypothetical protein GQ600_26436 [Phytophthora cactorum]|nr:hypothetical protein GQ600_26436 [Phytophthora cactorum]